jgi:hypothetical protein
MGWQDDPVAAPAAAATKPWEADPMANDRAIHEQRLARAEAELAEREGFGRKALNFGREFVDSGKATGDIALTLGTNAIMQPLAGVAGLITAPFAGSDNAANVVNKVGGWAYQPKSEAGQQAMAVFSKPFEWFAGKADQAGEAVSEFTGSPLLGTAVNTTIQGVPAFLAPEARGAFRSVTQPVVSGVRRTVAPQAEATAQAAQRAAQVQSAAEATAKAQQYAGSIGLDWARLSTEVKSQLSEIARTAGALEALDPAAVARAGQLASQRVPVPATRGRLTRNDAQLLREDLAKASPEGAPIKAIDNAADNALQANLDVLIGRVSGTGKTAAVARSAEEAGGAVQAAARLKEKVGKARYDNLYKIARETEPNAKAPVRPVTDLLIGNPEIQHLGWVQQWLNKAARAKGAPGEPVAITDATLAELQDLRSTAGEIARTGGKEGLYAGKVVRAIDESMEAVPEGAKAWKAANDAFKAHKREFSDQGAVNDLVAQASRTDRAVALENTIKTITNGSLEDIRKIKRSLLTGGDEATRTAGRQALREIRRKVAERIKEEATKSATEKSDGTPNLSLAKLKQTIDGYGPDKLREIFGEGPTRELYSVLTAAKIAKYTPGAVGSNTANKAVAMLSQWVDKIPGGSKVVDVARGVGNLKKVGEASRAAESAGRGPITTAAEEAAATRAKVERARQARGLQPAAIAAEQAAEQARERK